MRASLQRNRGLAEEGAQDVQYPHLDEGGSEDMKRLIIRKLIVDERNELFDAQGMRYAEFPSDFSRIREYTALVLSECPSAFKEGNLLEQQLSEIIKNGIKHGNRNDPSKRLRVWYDLRKRVRFIVEDE